MMARLMYWLDNRSFRVLDAKYQGVMCDNVSTVRPPNNIYLVVHALQDPYLDFKAFYVSVVIVITDSL